MVRGEITAEDQELSDHAPNAEYTAENVSNLQSQLAKTREEITMEELEPSVSALISVFSEADVDRGDIPAEDQELSKPAPLSVDAADDVAKLQRQLAEAREKISAKDQELAARDKIIKIM